MDKLQIGGTQLINLQENTNGEIIISGRELHEFLEIKTPYKKWFDRMKEYGFIEKIDFVTVGQKSPIANGGYQEIIEHALKLDMAKEIAMLQRNEKGKQARQYFLAVEKAWNSPEMIMKRALEIANKQVATLKIDLKSKERMLEELKPKVIFTNTVTNSNNSLLVREVAKLCCKEGLNIGEKRLWNKLREWDLICKKTTEPKQYGVDREWFIVVEGTRTNGKGTFTYNTTKVTGKGQVYIINRLKEEMEE